MSQKPFECFFSVLRSEVTASPHVDIISNTNPGHVQFEYEFRHSVPLTPSGILRNWPNILDFCWPEKYAAPESLHFMFVMTDEHGVRLYGHCVRSTFGEVFCFISAFAWVSLFQKCVQAYRANGEDVGFLLAFHSCCVPEPGREFLPSRQAAMEGGMSLMLRNNNVSRTPADSLKLSLSHLNANGSGSDLNSASSTGPPTVSHGPGKRYKYVSNNQYDCAASEHFIDELKSTCASEELGTESYTHSPQHLSARNIQHSRDSLHTAGASSTPGLLSSSTSSTMSPVSMGRFGTRSFSSTSSEGQPIGKNSIGFSHYVPQSFRLLRGLHRPPDGYNPFVDTRPSALLAHFDAATFITAIAALLCEMRICVVGENISEVSGAILSLVSVILPFQWPHIMITVVPDNLIDVVAAPTPFLIGLLESQIPKACDSVPEDVLMLRLHKRGVCYLNEQNLSKPPPPIPTLPWAGSPVGSLRLSIRQASQQRLPSVEADQILLAGLMDYFVFAFGPTLRPGYILPNFLERVAQKEGISCFEAGASKGLMRRLVSCHRTHDDQTLPLQFYEAFLTGIMFDAFRLRYQPALAAAEAAAADCLACERRDISEHGVSEDFARSQNSHLFFVSHYLPEKGGGFAESVLLKYPEMYPNAAQLSRDEVVRRAQDASFVGQTLVKLQAPWLSFRRLAAIMSYGGRQRLCEATGLPSVALGVVQENDPGDTPVRHVLGGEFFAT